MIPWGKLYQHWRQGTLLDSVKSKFGIVPESARIKWYGTSDPAAAARYLAKQAERISAGGVVNRWALSLGYGCPFHREVNRQLDVRGVPYRSASIEEIGRRSELDADGLAIILGACPDSRRSTQIARMLNSIPSLAKVPFEYVAGLDSEARDFRLLDEYPDTFFVSPVLLDEPSPYAIYNESLKLFEQKCGLRDYLDLYQLLKSVVINRVPGDVAEFGSYKGHSGWLIARTLQALGSDKRLFMFDMFEAFPAESLGVDQFWSQTHQVDFAEVRAKFVSFENVCLVKGDFTDTLPSSGLSQVAMAYIDCDSYRATRYLFEVFKRERLSSGSILACEDYGHPALLGNRAAVHESFDGVPGWHRFFSQFSGLYVAVKL